MKQRRTQIQSQSAFTLIELLIAIGIIVLLAGILFVAGRGVTTSSADKATRVNLASLNGMLGEFDAKTRLATSDVAWRWYDRSTSMGTTLSKGLAEFAADPNGNKEPLDAPGMVDDSSDVNRNASRQVLNTQRVMSFLLNVPANRTALEKTGAEHYLVPKWVNSTALATPGPDGVLYTADDGTESVWYVPGVRIQELTAAQKPPGKRYIFTTPGAGNAASAAPSAGGDWALDNGPVAPLLLDGWGNPMIFVPATGLRVRMKNGQKDYLTDGSPESKSQTVIIISPEGKVKDNPSTLGNPVVTQPGRPFWASAGPDGDFARGDDNIYSFQQ